MSEQRADARRNYDLLLTAAEAAFREHGTDASLRDIARRAGVGIGTLYRHFPTREALLEALLRSRFDWLRVVADELLAEDDVPRIALMAWLRHLTTGQTTYLGLPESVLAGLSDEESELHASCVGMRTAAARLLRRAQDAREVRADVTTDELFALAAGIAWASEHTGRPELVDKLLSVAMFGLYRSPFD